MAVDTKGILIGRQTAESIAAILRNHDGIGNVVMEHLADSGNGGCPAGARILFDDPSVNRRRLMYVFWDMGDAAIYAGERTLVSLGAFGSAVPIMENILAHFGGFILENDSKDTWRSVELRPDAGIILSPLDRLSVELGQSLGGREAELLRKVAADPVMFGAVMESLDRYRSSLDAARAPGVGGI